MSLFEDFELSPLDSSSSKIPPQNSLSPFLVDVAEFRSRAEARELPHVDSTLSDKEALSLNPGMSWLAGVSTYLVIPTSEDPQLQRSQLNSFIMTLKAEATFLPQAFTSTLPEGYHEPLLALDTETTGLDTRLRYGRDGKLIVRTQIVGLPLAISDTVGYYLPTMHTEADGVRNWSKEVIVEFIDQLAQTFTLIFHNANYDREVLALNGITKLRPFPYFFDTQILDYLYDVNQKSHGLKATSERHLGRKMIEISQFFNSKQHIEFEKLTATQAHIYGCADAINTFALFKYFASQLEDKNVFIQQPIPLQIDHKMVDVQRDMTRPGLPVNFRYFYYAAKDSIARLRLIEQAIYREAGKHFDIASSKQLGQVLFEDFKIPLLPGMEKGTSGNFSTKEDVLDDLFAAHPDFAILRYVVTYRKLQSTISKIYLKALANSFVDAHLPWTRIQLSFSQTNVPTGRLSSSSGDGKERVTVKFSEKSKRASYEYKRGSGDCGLNSQGIPNPYFKTAPARRITSLPPEAGISLSALYSEEVRNQFIQNLAAL